MPEAANVQASNINLGLELGLGIGLASRCTFK